MACDCSLPGGAAWLRGACCVAPTLDKNNTCMYLLSRVMVPAMLAKLRLSHGRVRVQGTPRRLAITVDALVSHQEEVVERVRGTWVWGLGFTLASHLSRHAQPCKRSSLNLSV